MASALLLFLVRCAFAHLVYEAGHWRIWTQRYHSTRTPLLWPLTFFALWSLHGSVGDILLRGSAVRDDVALKHAIIYVVYNVLVRKSAVQTALFVCALAGSWIYSLVLVSTATTTGAAAAAFALADLVMHIFAGCSGVLQRTPPAHHFDPAHELFALDSI